MPTEKGPHRPAPTRKRNPSNSGSTKKKPPVTAAEGTPRLLYRVAEVATMLGCDPTTVYDLARSGQLRYVRLAGGTMRIPAAAIDAYLSGDAA
jgi:excisionase family DNA binding protein